MNIVARDLCENRDLCCSFDEDASDVLSAYDFIVRSMNSSLLTVRIYAKSLGSAWFVAHCEIRDVILGVVCCDDFD